MVAERLVREAYLTKEVAALQDLALRLRRLFGLTFEELDAARCASREGAAAVASVPTVKLPQSPRNPKTTFGIRPRKPSLTREDLNGKLARVLADYWSQHPEELAAIFDRIEASLNGNRRS